MKITALILFCLTEIFVYAQQPVISVLASNEEIDFQFYINGKEYSEGPDNACIVQTLPIGKYTFTVTFDNDTIADVIKSFKIMQGKTYQFIIKSKSKLVKGISKTGRKINNNDYNDDKLVDFYMLEIKKN